LLAGVDDNFARVHFDKDFNDNDCDSDGEDDKPPQLITTDNCGSNDDEDEDNITLEELDLQNPITETTNQTIIKGNAQNEEPQPEPPEQPTQRPQ
jgi:hypothetical protein